jgi:hypothetical protein
MALYIKDEDVRVRLLGKVRFTENDEDENRMNVKLLRRLINEAEGEVEYDLSPRYTAPFVTDSGAPFSQLPARPTQEIIKTMCELKAVVRVLETDFGRGTVVDSDKYGEQLRTRYDSIKLKLLERRENLMSGWKYPPLPGLKLNYMNTEADDGYQGMVLSTSEGLGSYPLHRINSPSENWTTFKDGDEDR